MLFAHTCRAEEPQGHDAQAGRAGKPCSPTSTSDGTAAPPSTDPALVLPTRDQTPEESAACVYSLLAERGLV